MKALVAGWFSFQGMGATAGDLMVRDVACDWLEEAGYAYDVAIVPPFTHERGLDWRGAAPADYDCVLFVCGPIGNGPPVNDFLAHFHDCPKIGLDLTMLQKLSDWNPFDLLLERDSDRAANPDLALACRAAKVPVVGVILAQPQKEYRKTGLHATANAAFHRLTSMRQCAVLYIDTCLDPWNQFGLRTPAQIESVIAKMDVVLTTRLHGLVLSLKNHVPAIVIDPVKGGAKLTRQARVLGWPVVFSADAVTDDALAGAFEHCLTEPARIAARAAADKGVTDIRQIRERFLAELPRVAIQRGRAWHASS
ncbi:MAG: polysaccharide pyruvyl transferase family protein [Tepidisphaeraceae bacterium]